MSRSCSPGPIAPFDVLLLLSCSLGLVASCSDENAALAAAPPRAPVLFTTVGECPLDAASGAGAERLERRGRIRIERYPYDAQDGVRGVMLMQHAVACYRAAGLDAAATRLDARVTRLAAKLESDFAAARVAFEHALTRGRIRIASALGRKLLAMTEHVASNSYVDWLEAQTARVFADEGHSQ